MPHTQPEFQKSAFNCPYCNAYAKMTWCQLYYPQWLITPLHLACCSHCQKDSYWIKEDAPRMPVMLVPSASQGPMPHLDMPEEVRADYDEARNIVSQSPRGAAALLRLAIQKLCQHFGEKGENLNEDIRALVKKGLPTEIQQALDIVRVIGNNAVHPGELSKDDVSEVASTLFDLVNQITEERIARPKKLQTLFGNLPQKDIENIAKRDKAKDA